MRLHQIRAPCDSRNNLTRRLRRPKSRPCSARALLQLVAIDDCARIARHIVEDAALDKRVYAGVTEQDQRRTIIIAARIARDLPSLREQLVDRQRCLRCRQARRRQHRCPDSMIRLALRMFLSSFPVRPSYLARHQEWEGRGENFPRSWPLQDRRDAIRTTMAIGAENKSAPRQQSSVVDVGQAGWPRS